MSDGWDCSEWDELPEERKEQLMKTAEELFNSDQSPLSFMVKSNGSVTFIPNEKKWWEFWK